MEQNKSETTTDKNETSNDNAWEIMAVAERLNAVRRRVADEDAQKLTEEQLNQTLMAVVETERRYERQLTDSELTAIVKAEPSFYGVAHKLDANGFPTNAAGKVFEKSITNWMVEQFGYVEKKEGMFSRLERDMSTHEANIAEDILEGADLMVSRLPIDITLNSEKGGKIGSVNADGETEEGFAMQGNIDGVAVKSGFRITNGQHKLSMPVCVILFEGAKERLSPEDMMEKIWGNPVAFKRLADDAMSAYWDYTDATDMAA